jgi:hypothetical protein
MPAPSIAKLVAIGTLRKMSWGGEPEAASPRRDRWMERARKQGGAPVTAVTVTLRDRCIPCMVGSASGGIGVCLDWRPPGRSRAGRSRGMGVCSERCCVTLSYPTPPGTEILRPAHQLVQQCILCIEES